MTLVHRHHRDRVTARRRVSPKARAHDSIAIDLLKALIDDRDSIASSPAIDRASIA